MERMNEVRIIGNVGQFKPGEKNIYMAIALNESYKPQNSDDWVEQTVWVDVVAFGPTMNKISKQNIATGDAVLVMGKLSQREYEGKRNTQIIAQKVQLIKKSGKASGGVTDNEMPDTSGAITSKPADDDLPF